MRGGEWQQGVGGFFVVYKAYLRCRRRKRATPQAQFYEAYLLDNLVETAQALRTGHWRPRRPVCFMVDKPKAREIHAAHYGDRVIHHLLVPGLEELYEPVFIHDVYSNRRGKGTHLAVKRLQHFMRSVSRPGRNSSPVKDTFGNGDYCPSGYFLQLDIRNFFNSVYRSIVFALLQKRLRKGVKQGRLSESVALFYRQLSHIILKQDVGKESFLVATRAEAARVPPHKRLINAGKNKGLPIGNLTSQFFANVYLNELDQFVKHKLKCRRYLRYVDDFILLNNDPEQLRRWSYDIEIFLKKSLALELKVPQVLQSVQQGVNFLGYIVRPAYLLIRQRVIGNLWEKLLRFERQWIKGDKTRGWTIVLLPEPRDHLLGVLASYMGHFKHACHHRLVRRMFTRFPWLSCLFVLYQDRLIPLWQPQQVSSYKSQQRFFRRIFPNAEIAIQCGSACDRFIDVRQSDLPKDNPRYVVSKVVVRQQGYLKGGLRRRCVESLFIPSLSRTGVLLCETVYF